jgi:hypothetical protein
MKEYNQGAIAGEGAVFNVKGLLGSPRIKPLTKPLCPLNNIFMPLL